MQTVNDEDLTTRTLRAAPTETTQGCSAGAARTVYANVLRRALHLPEKRNSDSAAADTLLACIKNKVVLGIEPRTSRTLSENHTTRPKSLYAHTPHWSGAWGGRSAGMLAIRSRRANPAPAGFHGTCGVSRLAPRSVVWRMCCCWGVALVDHKQIDACGIRTHAGKPHRLSRPTP
jgi:hypothetical protein